MRWVLAYFLAGLAWAIYAQVVQLTPVQSLDWYRELARERWDVLRHGPATREKVDFRAVWARRANFGVLFVCDLLFWWIAVAFCVVMPSDKPEKP